MSMLHHVVAVATTWMNHGGKMKRIAQIVIDDCTKCPHFETVDGFSSHSFICPYFGQSKTIDTPESRACVEKELKEWFRNCPQWNITTAST